MLDYEKLFIAQTECFAKANDEILTLNTRVRVQQLAVQRAQDALEAARVDIRKLKEKLVESEANSYLWETEALRLQRKEEYFELARKVRDKGEASEG